MGLDLYKLDAIRNHKKAIAALENYVDEIIDEFLEAPEGQAYIKANPDEEDYVGEWFLKVLELAYETEAVTLPHLNPETLEALLTQTLPSKLSKEEVQDAGSLIPELMTFWSFLKRAYRLSTASAILQMLRKIHPVFNRKLKLDKPTNTASGASIQGLYESNGRGPSGSVATNNAFPASSPLSDPISMLESLNIEVDDDSDIPDLDDDFDFELDDDIEMDLDEMDDDPGFDQDFKRANKHPLAPSPRKSREAIASNQKNLNTSPTKTLKVGHQHGPIALAPDHEPKDEPEHKSDPALDHQPDPDPDHQFDPDPEETDCTHSASRGGITEVMTAEATPSESSASNVPSDALVPLPTPDAIALLTEQIITEQAPGPILHDFQVLLEAVGSKGIAVSGKTQSIPMKLLGELNARMIHPIGIGLKRPLQKSYPNIHGLCLLLRASGLGIITKKGKKDILSLNPELMSLWQQLNPTEKYCALLEAWMVRGSSELVGDRERRSDQDAFSLWNRVISHLSPKDHSELLSYASGTYTIALMQMFGLIELQSAAPQTGKGWQIKSFKQTPFGLALMPEIQRAYFQNGWGWASERDSLLPLNELQGTLQPYFPEWKMCLSVSLPDIEDGVYTFQVVLQQVQRWIAISGEQSLFALSQMILDAVNFDHDHLDVFHYRDVTNRKVSIYHPYCDEGPFTDEIEIRDLRIPAGTALTYLFDFGDRWEFQLTIESIDSQDLRRDYIEVIEAHGEAPEQYPSYE